MQEPTSGDRLVRGGFEVDASNRVHTTFTHNPSTLRLSSANPNLQNIPRSGGLGKMVKEIFVAPPGKLLWEADFSAIEAVLVGYFSGSANYYRFAKMGVHAYLASHLAGKPVDLAWSDSDIKAYFKEIKANHAAVYDVAKRVVHGSNYMMTPRKMNYDFPEFFPTIKEAAARQGLYFELFPEIPRWHRDLAERVDGTKRRKLDPDVRGEVVDPWTLGVCHVRNPFGYTHRFYNVLDWEKFDGRWVSTFGEDAKRLVAFLPQSTAAAILKRAVKRVWYDVPEVGRDLRLLVHDSIVGESSIREVDATLRVVTSIMTEHIPELPLDPAWGLGEYVTIGVETKAGPSWANMKG